jgi:hypothetical protein
MHWGDPNPRIGQDIGVDTDHSAAELGIIMNEIAKGLRVMHQHPGSNGGRQPPSRRILLLDRRVRAYYRLRPPLDHLGNTPLLIASHSLNLSIEVV